MTKTNGNGPHSLLINSDDGTADKGYIILTEDTTTVADIKRMVAEGLSFGVTSFTIGARTRHLRRRAKAAFKQMGIQIPH